MTRFATALFLVLLAFVAHVTFASEVDVDVDVDVDLETETENHDLPSLAETEAAADSQVAAEVQMLAGLPSGKSLPGHVVQLRFAPGAIGVDENKLPPSLMPTTLSDPNVLADIKLWESLTRKIHIARRTQAKYRAWLSGAKLALKRVNKQIAITRKNEQTIKRAIASMIHRRRKVVKRLRTFKLTNHLNKATAKLRELDKYGRRITSLAGVLSSEEQDMRQKVNAMERGITHLRKAEEDLLISA